MKEFIRRIVGRLQPQRNNRLEAVPVLQPSSFVLTQDGQERTLVNGETISLNPGTQVPEDDKIQSFLVFPNPHSLSLMIRWESGYHVKSSWGIIDSFAPGERKERFGICLRPVAFTSQDGKSYIKGSSMYFDRQETRLHGDDWVLEYKPDSKS